MRRFVKTLTAAVMLLVGSIPREGFSQGAALRQGDRFELGGRTVSVLQLDTLPCVENELTKRYQPDKYGDPVLEKLRRDERLDAVVAPGRTEFEKQLLLMEWANRQIQYGDPVELGKVRDPLELLSLSRKGRVLYCECFASLYIAAAASLGWVCRPVDIPTHSFTEIWSNTMRRWVMMDPTGHFYAEKNGVPLNVYEIRKDWFENGGKNLVFKRGRERYVGGGRGFAPYTVLYYTLKREWLGNRPADGMMATVDQWSRGRSVKPELVLKDPANDPYFPVNQASLTVEPAGSGLKVFARTFTPNFKTFRVRKDEGPWTDSPASFAWTLHEGTNLLEVASVNLFGVAGPVGTVEVFVAEKGSRDIIVPATAFSAEGGGITSTRSRAGNDVPSYVAEWNTPGQWLEWNVESPAAADYDLTLTYASIAPAARQVRVNGAVVTGLERPVVGPTGRWDNFSQALLPTRVPLKEGRNVLRMTAMDADALFLSEIRFSSPRAPDIVLAATSFAAEGGGTARRMVSPPAGYFRFWDLKDHWIEWTADVPEAGPWTVYLQYATLYNTASRDLSVNGAVAKGLEKFTPPMTGNWTMWSEYELPAPATLRQGKNVLRMNNLTGRGINMAGLRLVGPSGQEVYVPAISMTAQGGAPPRSMILVSPSRHRSLYRWDARGHWLEWTVRAPAEGDYDVTLNYAAGRTGARSVQVNGEQVKGLEACALEATGGFQEWKEKKLPGPVRLKAGDNTLRLTNAGGSVNLDEVRLTPVM